MWSLQKSLFYLTHWITYLSETHSFTSIKKGNKQFFPTTYPAPDLHTRPIPALLPTLGHGEFIQETGPRHRHLPGFLKLIPKERSFFFFYLRYMRSETHVRMSQRAWSMSIWKDEASTQKEAEMRVLNSSHSCFLKMV